MTREKNRQAENIVRLEIVAKEFHNFDEIQIHIGNYEHVLRACWPTFDVRIKMFAYEASRIIDRVATVSGVQG